MFKFAKISLNLKNENEFDKKLKIHKTSYKADSCANKNLVSIRKKEK